MPEGPIQYSQEMIFHGTQVLRLSGLLKPDVDLTQVMVLATKIYGAMERVRPDVIRPKDFFKGGI